jgi:translocation and assembly module TamB
MTHGARVAQVVTAVASSLSILLLIAMIAVMAVTGTDWGRERVRRYVQAQLQSRVVGEVRIGRITGNLLSGMTVRDIVIRDSAGKPFVAVAAIRGDYSLMELVRRRIWIRNAVVVQPLIVLDRPPDGTWNWKAIFARDTSGAPSDTVQSWGDWIRFTDLRVIEGDVVVRTPWRPHRNLRTQAARDSAIRAALAGETQVLVERVPGGFQKVVQLRSVTATIPLLRIADPEEDHRLIRVSALEMDAYPFRPPAAEIIDLKGLFPFNDDSVWWKGVHVRMPGTNASGNGSYVFESGDMTVEARASPASGADMRWLYPRIPAEAYGSLNFSVKWRGAVEDYRGWNADFRLGVARVRGMFGMQRADSVLFHPSDLTFSEVDTRLLEQLLAGFEAPRRGTLSGRTRFRGGRNALEVDGDVAFADARGAGTSRVLARGEIGFPGEGIRARDLHVQLRPFQVELARTYAPTMPISGVVTGSGIVNGSTTGALRIAADIEHRDRGTLSALNGRIDLTRTGRGIEGWRFDADLHAHPVSLVEVGRFFPDVGLQGTATGPIRVEGTMRAMTFATDARLVDGGRLVANGQLAFRDGSASYDVRGSLHTFNARTILARAPRTDLTALVAARGSGTELATMQSTFAADLSTSQWDSVAVDTASVRGRIARGRLELVRLEARGGHTFATASGAFGLIAGQSGTITYRVAVDSLAAFNRWLPGLGIGPDTGIVPPRPGLVAAAMRTARADSLRIAKRTEVERFVTGKPAPTLNVRMPRSVRRDTIGGVLFAAGTVSGNIHDFDVRGRAGGEDIALRGNFVRRLSAEYAWTDARTPASKAIVGIDADSVMAQGFALDTVAVRLSYAAPNGHAEILVRQDNERDYSVVGDFSLAPSGKEVRISDLRARLDTSLWSAPHPSAIRWGGPGIEVVNLELVNRSNGRIFAHGLLPTEGISNFELAVDNLPTANIVDLLQSDLELDGDITMRGTMRGTLTNPTFQGRFTLLSATYRGDTLPHLRGSFAYADRLFDTSVDMFRLNGAPMATLSGRVPVNLALRGVIGPRLIDAPVSADLMADSLPLELVPHFTDLLSNVHGQAGGRVALRGPIRRPSLSGGIVLTGVTMTINATGQTIEHINGTVRMAGDTVYLGGARLAAGPADQISASDMITGISRDSVRLRGTIAVGRWRDPVFNLYLNETNAEVLNNKWGKLRADVSLAFTGTFAEPRLSGQATIKSGVIRAPEPTGKRIIGAGDPALFAVMDTSVAADRALFPAQSPLFRNLAMEVVVEIERSTWVRNSDANVEVFTDFPLYVRKDGDQLALTGVVATDRGEYSFMSKRFQVRRGSAMFVGIPELNPTLQITGEYQVQTPGASAVAIRVLIGGTLQRPRLSLESDAQPPRSQGELMSLLAFGQATSSLLAFDGSSVAAFGTGTDLVGLGAGLAVRRLAMVALGVAVDEVELEAGKALGTDVFNITPADVPTELWQGRGLGNILTQTRVEAGKYVNPRTFLGVQTVGFNPGMSLQHRTAKGWRLEASMLPRILLGEPSLSQQVGRTRQAYGGFIIREWRY